MKTIKPRNENQYRAIRSNCDYVIMAGGGGGGKLQNIDSLILSVNGWVRMGDIKMGDELVSPFGNKSFVTGIYPQGIKSIYKFTTVDNRSCECGLEHLWQVKYFDNLVVLTTKQILDRGLQYFKVPIYKEGYVQIKSIEYVGDKEAQCISVSDQDHLYITNDYIVTHNTFTQGYSLAYDVFTNEQFSALWLMKNVEEFEKQGGVADQLMECYPLNNEKKRKKEAIGTLLLSKQRVEFDNGANIQYMHLADERNEVILNRFKSLQINKVILDEADRYSAFTLSNITTRLRGKGKGKRQIIFSLNPERECFIRDWILSAGWIGMDGEPIAEMNGSVMYGFWEDGKMEETVWGKTPDEVYKKARVKIDKLIKGSRLNKTPDKWCSKVVFFTFDPKENQGLFEENPDYEKMLAQSVSAASMYHSNWNYSKKDDELAELSELTPQAVRNMFVSNPNIFTYKRRITCDPAMEGSDNCVMLMWEGNHIIDIEFYPKCNHNTLAKLMNNFRLKHKVDMSDMIIDVQKEGLYLKEHFPTAQYFSGAEMASERSKGAFYKRKDEAGGLAVQMINNGLITFDKRLENLPYKHQKMVTSSPTLCTQMIFESRIFTFETASDGKRKMLDKVKQKSILKGMSPDIFDNIIMWCGMMYYDCYRMLADKKVRQGNSNKLNIDGNSTDESLESIVDRSFGQSKKTENASHLLNKAMGW